MGVMSGGCCGEDEEEEKKKGSDEDFDGLNKNRSCTDILCLGMFIAFMFGMFFLFFYAWSQGDVTRLTQGYDVSGNICGKDNTPIIAVDGSVVFFSGVDMTSRPFMYIDLIRTAQISGGDALDDVVGGIGENLTDKSGSYNSEKLHFCLDGMIPASTTTTTTAASTTATTTTSTTTTTTTTATSPISARRRREAPGDGVHVLKYLEVQDETGRVFKTSSLLSEAELEEKVAQSFDLNHMLSGAGSCRYCLDKCPEGTKPIFSRCLPDVSSTAEALLGSLGIDDVLTDIVADIKISWVEILYMSLIALVLALGVTMLLRFAAGIVVYVVIAAVVISCIAGTIFLWVIWSMKSDFYETHFPTNTTLSHGENVVGDNDMSRLTTAYSQDEVNYYMAAAIFASVATIVVLLIIFVMRNRIKLVIQLFIEAGKAAQSMPLILIQPLWTFIALVVVCSMWVLGLLMVESAGHPEPDSITGFVYYKKDQFLSWMRLYHIFGGFWITQFVIACQHVTIAGAVSTWYFTREKSSLRFPILVGLKNLIRYHLGSVAFGSFIIALIKFIRMIMAYVEKKIKKQQGLGPAKQLLLVIIKCCQCCLACFERCMKFLNKNAYIEVAIYGYNFCSAARRAFKMLTSNVMRVAAINSVGTFVLFLAKVAVVVATVFIGMAIMRGKAPEADGHHVTYEWVPILISALFAYIVADCFISVYGMAVDTIFLCFCEDSDRNDGESRPYFMSTGLMQFLSDSEAALKAERERKYAKKGLKPPSSAGSVKKLGAVEPAASEGDLPAVST